MSDFSDIQGLSLLFLLVIAISVIVYTETH